MIDSILTIATCLLGVLIFIYFLYMGLREKVKPYCILATVIIILYAFIGIVKLLEMMGVVG
jgi:hypothetical protein